MKRKTVWLIAAVIVFVCVIAALVTPRSRAAAFVWFHGEKIEASLEQGVPIPIKAKAINTWPGEHSMTEFLLFAWGNTYYGCYYSPDDVPLAFQNTQVSLTRDGHNYWVWKEAGDNHGLTARIRDKWYYFEASF